MPFLSGPHQAQLVQVHQPTPPSPKMTVFAAFNHHAQSCSRCRKPLEVVRRGEQLCEDGHRIAIDVARALYKIAGAKATQYGTENFHVSLLVDFTGITGPVYDLCLALDQGLNRSAAAKEQPAAVHYIRPRSVQEHRDPHSSHSRHHHSHSVGSPSSSGYYTASSSPSPRPRRESRDDSMTPRRTGNIRVNIPIEYGQEESYYEEFSHSNGGRVTTKYYHTDRETPRPHLSRANTVTEVARPARKSTVHFDPEVKYYR